MWLREVILEKAAYFWTLSKIGLDLSPLPVLDTQ